MRDWLSSPFLLFFATSNFAKAVLIFPNLNFQPDPDGLQLYLCVCIHLLTYLFIYLFITVNYLITNLFIYLCVYSLRWLLKQKTLFRGTQILGKQSSVILQTSLQKKLQKRIFRRAADQSATITTWIEKTNKQTNKQKQMTVSWIRSQKLCETKWSYLLCYAIALQFSKSMVSLVVVSCITVQELFYR